MFYPTTGWMLFDQQDLFQPPVIHRSQNGWIYKPDEARTPQEIRNGTNKAWPRSKYSSNQEHAEWHNEFMWNELAKRNWRLPTKIEKPLTDDLEAGSNNFAFHWNSKPWGWQYVTLGIRDAATYGRDKGKLTLSYEVSTHPAAQWYIDRSVESCYRSWGGLSQSYQYTDRDQVREKVRQWLDAPWSETVAHLPEGVTSLTDVMNPPIEKMQKPEWLTGEDDVDDLDFYARTTGTSSFWAKGKIEEIMKSDVAWKALGTVLEAFAFTGYDIRVDTEYNYYDKDMPIKGFQIEIPEDPNSLAKARKSGHTIKISREGIKMVCGFVQDENLWMEREKRLARDHMALLEEDLFTEFSIDLNDE